MITTHFAIAAPGDSGSGMLRVACLENFPSRGPYVLPSPVRILDDTAHMSAEQIRASEHGVTVPIITHVRNPFDYYISRWLHLVRNGTYRGSFKDHVLRDWPATAAAETAGYHHATYREYWEHYVGRARIPDERVIRFEHFADDVARTLGELCAKLGPEYFAAWFPRAYMQWRRLEKLEDIEQVLRFELYDDELRAFVEENDTALLERFGYWFEDRTDG